MSCIREAMNASKVLPAFNGDCVDNPSDACTPVACGLTREIDENMAVTKNTIENKESVHNLKDKFSSAKGKGGAESSITSVFEINGKSRVGHNSLEAPSAVPRTLPAHGCRRTRGTTWVRVRPLLPQEIASGCGTVPGLVLESRGCLPGEEESSEKVAIDAAGGDSRSSSNCSDSGVCVLEGRVPIAGFTGVLGQNAGNAQVFRRTIQPCLPTVMNGGTASLFCYGYTGAGKTHTVFGVVEDPGLYHRAAAELLQLVQEHNSAHCGGNAHTKTTTSGSCISDADAGAEQCPLLLRATVVEVYNNNAFDLLGGRVPCALRVNSSGLLSVRGATTKQRLSEQESVAAGGAEFAIITTGLTAVIINSLEDLNSIYQQSKQHRSVGTSTEHDTSSRSHVVFRLEIVHAKLLEAMARLEDAESIKPGLQSLRLTLDVKRKLENVEKVIKQTTVEIAGMHRAGTALGGQLLVVDLAGADSDSRDICSSHSVAQRKESTAINMSLLALKECLRGLYAQSDILPSTASTHSAGSSEAAATTTTTVLLPKVQKLPFRDSIITRLLEEVLVGRPGRDTDNVMLVNVAPAAHLEKKTINSLRYGQLYASSAASSTNQASKKLLR